jgi:N-methylhydantoinase B
MNEDQTNSWDGLRRSYVAASPPSVKAGTRLHQEVDTDVDPVTLEVIRYALMNVNLEHCDLLQKLCVSPVTMMTRDYQATMLTEDGELLFLGSGVQWFSNSHSMAVRWMLEHRGDKVRPGDQFVCNDPWIAAAHHSDVTVLAPVFVDDKIFCWVANATHMSDVGGTVPGSFCVQAEDVWQEPMSWRPVGIVKAGELDEDLEALFMRQSRFPDVAQMDLRASIGANEASSRKIAALAERYGPSLVKGVMKRILDAGEQLFEERLEAIPDGRWSHHAFTEAAVPGDRGIYCYQVNLRKSDGRIVVDNEGTDPQVAGSINVTLASFAGTALCAIVPQLVPELGGAYGGAYRRIVFDPKPGLLNCADYPAATSPSGALTSPMLAHVAGAAIGKMLCSGDEESRARALGPSVHHFYGPIVAGAGAGGEPFIFPDTNAMMGSLAGRPGRDGVDLGGHWWIPDGIGYNSEDVEAQYPIVVLGRSISPAGLDGAGRHRAGVSFREAFTPFGSAGAEMVFYANDSFPKGEGLFGGSMGSMGRFKIRRGSDALAQMKIGSVPTSLEELTGEHEPIAFKGPPVSMIDGDVIEFVSPSSPGFGDPLRRDPDLVQRDVAAGYLDPKAAERVYGVVIHGEVVNADRTVEVRLSRRRERLGGAEPAEPQDPPAGARSIGDLLHIVAGRWWASGADLGPAKANFRDCCRMREIAIDTVGPEFATEDPEMAAKVVYREYVCPVTGFLLDTEIARVGDDPGHEISIG